MCHLCHTFTHFYICPSHSFLLFLSLTPLIIDMCLSYLYDIVVVIIALGWLLISIILINYDARDIQLAGNYNHFSLLLLLFSLLLYFCYNGPMEPLKSSQKIRPLSLFLNVLTKIYASFDSLNSFTYAKESESIIMM